MTFVLGITILAAARSCFGLQNTCQRVLAAARSCFGLQNTCQRVSTMTTPEGATSDSVNTQGRFICPKVRAFCDFANRRLLLFDRWYSIERNVS